MCFSPDDYKVVDISIFGKASEFCDTFTFGDVVLLDRPRFLSYERGFGLSISKEEKIVHLGESEDYTNCPVGGCPSFFNKKL